MYLFLHRFRKAFVLFLRDPCGTSQPLMTSIHHVPNGPSSAVNFACETETYNTRKIILKKVTTFF